MNRIWLMLLLGWTVVIVAEAQRPETVVSVNTEVTDTLEHALLWKISSKDLDQPSYLYGTIHMIGKDDFFLTEATESALKSTERLALEINMDEMMNNMGAMFGMVSKMFMNDNQTLRDLLSEEDYAIVKAHFEEIGMPLMFLERVKPMFLSAMGAGESGNPMDANSGMVSYEMEFMKMAKADDMEMAGLETAEFQMSMFDSIPYEAQAQMLVESIRSTDTEDDQFGVMVDLYRQQNINAMIAMMDDEEGGLGEYEELLLVKRNENWIPIMGEMMKSKPTFFAVGAGHLGGKRGVIRLLRAAGYQVEPIL